VRPFRGYRFTGTAAVLAILGRGAGGQDVSAIVDGSVVVGPAGETFPFIPGTALDRAVEYAKQRYQFGRPIGSSQAIKHMLADRFVQLDTARLLVACMGRHGH
jgi:Acyl-CoA dehydrogenase, C-terminal domain